MMCALVIKSVHIYLGDKEGLSCNCMYVFAAGIQTLFNRSPFWVSKLGIMPAVKYEDGFVKFSYYNQRGFPDPPPVDPSTTELTYFPNINISLPPPPPWTLASKLSEEKRILFTSNAQSMLDHYNKIKDTNFEFVRLVRVQTYANRGDDHYIQFEAKPSGAADHTPKTFEAAIYEQFNPTYEVFPVACGLVVSNN